VSVRGHGAWPHLELDAREEDADAIGAALVDAGSLGVEQRETGGGRVTLVAYFDQTPEVASVVRAVAATPGVHADYARAAAESIRAGETPDDDWLRIWKRGFEPVEIGSRLVVFPSWKRDLVDRSTGRVAIEVDPGMAFGTGTHETTRLCLEWLDEHWSGGSALDVGTGSGILAIAAALLASESRVVAVDVDPVAVDVARENAELNGVAERIVLDAAGPEGVSGEFDVVLANLTADVIDALRPHLTARVRAGGRLVLSGILLEQADDVIAEMEAAGFSLVWRRDAGEWTALEMRRP
jgi:ribosomal protein L11 methyltransferase